MCSPIARQGGGGACRSTAAGAPAVPEGVPLLVVPTPPEIADAYGIPPSRAGFLPARCSGRNGSPASRRCPRAPRRHLQHDLHLRHDGPSQGRAPPQSGAAAAQAMAAAREVFGIVPGRGDPHRHDRPGLSLRAQRVRPSRRARGRPRHPSAAFRGRRSCCGSSSSTASPTCTWCRPCSCGCCGCPKRCNGATISRRSNGWCMRRRPARAL